MIMAQDIRGVLARGAGGAFLTAVTGTGAALGLQIVLARSLGAEEYGIYIYVLTWIASLQLVSNLGFSSAYIRFIPAYATDEDWSGLKGIVRAGPALVVPAAFSIAAITVAIALLFEERMGTTLSRGFLVGSALLPVVALLDLLQGALLAMKRVILGQIPVKILRPLVLGALIAGFSWALGRNVASSDALGINLAVSAVVLALAASWTRSSLPRNVRTTAPRFAVREWLRVSLPLLFVAEMRVVMNSADIILVGMLIGTVEAGIYSVASRMSQLASFGQMAIAMIAGPMMSEFHTKQEHATLQRTMTMAALGASASALVIGLVVVLTAPVVLSWFGEEFRAGFWVVVVLVTGQFLSALTGPVGTLLNISGHHDANARIIFLTAMLNVCLNIPAILWFGMEGASIVTGSLFLVKNVWTWMYVLNRLDINSSIIRLPDRR